MPLYHRSNRHGKKSGLISSTYLHMLSLFCKMSTSAEQDLTLSRKIQSSTNRSRYPTARGVEPQEYQQCLILVLSNSLWGKAVLDSNCKAVFESKAALQGEDRHGHMGHSHSFFTVTTYCKTSAMVLALHARQCPLASVFAYSPLTECILFRILKTRLCGFE